MMADAPRDGVPAAGRVPTLTEVIEGIDAAGRADVDQRRSKQFAEAFDRPATLSPDNDRRPADHDAHRHAEHDDRIGQALAVALARVQAEAQARLHDALQPILVEAADRLAAALHAELASSLRDLTVATTATELTTPPTHDRRSADSFDA